MNKTYIPVMSLIFDDPSEFEISSNFSCNCDSCDSLCPCIIRFSSSSYAFPLVSPLFECNQHCKCKTCSNNLLTYGSTCKLSIRLTNSKGLGVFTEEFIPKNTFIGEYAGRLVDMDCQGKYVFQLRENTPSRTIITTINAEYFGNFTRFINHSCEPNLEVKAIRRDYIIPHITFFTIKDIEIGDELSFKYRENGLENKCLCESNNCRGFY